MESIDFSANNISAMGIKALSQVLPANGFLKTLNLSGNNIGDEGVQVWSLCLLAAVPQSVNFSNMCRNLM